MKKLFFTLAIMLFRGAKIQLLSIFPRIISTILCVFFLSILGFAQVINPSNPSYDSLKASGYFPIPEQTDHKEHFPEIIKMKNVLSGLLIPRDTTFTLALEPNDDFSTAAIALPFIFEFYSSNQTQFHINNNGNVSFGRGYGTYSSTGFPVSNFPMLAPFWADVDTRPSGSGLVYYKIEAHRITVIWDGVGYYGNHIDKLNTFEVIFTDGTDELIGIGNNVAFSYGDMQWTTGDASGGSGGFGGTPATVGINKGDGVNFALIGRFDHAGIDYDGPGGNTDGVSYLDNNAFIFNTGTSVTNVPPVPTGFPSGTVSLNIGSVNAGTVQFLSPETIQITTTVVNSGSLTSFSFTSIPGQISTVDYSLTGTINNVGTWSVQFVATDNGIPPLSTTKYILFEIIDQSPTISSSPPSTVLEHALYQYDVDAIDPDIPFGDILTYQLLTYPSGMTINPQNGLIGWTPGDFDVGNHNVSVKVADLFGKYAIQSFVLIVINVNDPPAANAGLDQTILSSQIVTLYGSGSYDIDSDPILYNWTAPQEILLSDPTAVNPMFTSPVFCINKTYTFSLVVNDGEFYSSADTVVITALPAPPEINFTPSTLTVQLISGANSTQLLKIKNTGFCDLAINVSSIVSWLNIIPNFNAINPGDSIAKSVLFDAINLTAGIFNTEITIISNDPDEPIVHVPVALIVHDILHVTACANPSAICTGSPSLLSANANGGFGNYTYSWTSDPPGFNSTLQNPTVNPVINTTYKVIVTDGQNVDSSSVFVSVFQAQPPGAINNMLPIDNSIIPQLSVTLSWQPCVNANIYDLYVWKSSDPVPAQPVVLNLAAIQYTYYNLSYATAYKWKIVAKKSLFSNS